MNDKAFDALKTMRWQPALRTVPPYHDEPVYIDALAESIGKHLAALDFEPEVVLASYHGLPKSYFEKGDPYHCHCQKTSRLLRERLGWSEERLITTFQSRFGPEEWLQPYTDKTVERLAGEGVKRIAIVNPGFVSDCLETLEEIAVQNREIFLHHGGEQLRAHPLPERFAGGHAGHHHDRAARAAGLDLKAEVSGWIRRAGDVKIDPRAEAGRSGASAVSLERHR